MCLEGKSGLIERLTRGYGVHVANKGRWHRSERHRTAENRASHHWGPSTWVTMAEASTLQW